MNKFGRNYLLSVEGQGGQLISIAPPFTVEFDITRSTNSSANVCQIKAYNLSPKNRNNILFNKMDTSDFRSVQLMAGYGTNMPVIFTGNITQAFSVREGNNFITTIESFDGGSAYNNGVANVTLPSGTTQRTAILTLAGLLSEYDIQIGAIGNTYTAVYRRGGAVSGNIMDALKNMTGGGVFIDNGTIHMLADNECLFGEVQIINAAMGLLGTPTREQTIITVDMLFEPRLMVGQVVQLMSATAQNFNSLYKVISVKHRGMISGAVSGNAITSIGMYSVANPVIVVPIT